MSMNFNINPYFDDYNPEKDFRKILFRPGIPVQARELTQIQTLLQEQIKRFGDHIFKNGTMVIPGTVDYDFNVYSVSVALDGGVDTAALEGAILVSGTSGIRMLVLKFVAGTPNKLIVKIVSASASAPAQKVPANGETISTEDDDYDLDSVGTISATPTTASIASITEGIFYFDGSFIRVGKQSIVLSHTSKTPTKIVTLDLVDEIFDDSDDASLRDPALGSSNENAPGAHRHKQALILAAHDTKDDLTEKSIILLEILSGEVDKQYTRTEYAELMKMIARRTFEESGNYTARPHSFFITEKDDDTLTLKVSGGLSFIGGNEIDVQYANARVDVPKARTVSDNQNNNISRFRVGNSFYASDIQYLPDVWQTIEFTDDSSVTGTPAGNIIGFGKVRNIRRVTGYTNLFEIFVFDTFYTPGKTFDDVAAFNGVTGSVFGNVVHELTVSAVTGEFNGTDELVATKKVSSEPDRVVIPVGLDLPNNKIFARKKNGSTNLWLKRGDKITQDTTDIQGNISTIVRIKNPKTTSPILNIPSPTTCVHSITDMSYFVARKATVTVTAGAASYSFPAGYTLGAPADVTIVDAATGDPITGWATSSLEGDGSLSITGLGGVASVNIFLPARKSTANSRSFSLPGNGTLTNVVPRSRIALPETYVRSFTVEGASTSKDYTKYFTLDAGQDDSVIRRSSLVLKRGFSISENIDITYVRADNSGGDVTVVDSYSAFGTGLSYIGKIPKFKNSQGTNFILQNCVDARPHLIAAGYVTASATASNTTMTLDDRFSTGMLAVGMSIRGRGLSTTIATITGEKTFTVTVAPSVTGNFAFIVGTDITATVAASQEAVVEGLIQFDYDFFLPARYAVFLTGTGQLSFYNLPEKSQMNSFILPDNKDRMRICDLNVPAYTYTPKHVSIKKYMTRGYTMKDIGSLEKRIANVEELTLLNMLEQDLASTQIIDPQTGLTRFKNGFAVDNFSNHSVADVDGDLLGHIVYNDRYFTTFSDEDALSLITLTDGFTNAHKTSDDVLLLNYTHEKFIEQSLASTTENVNPFAVFRWTGEIQLTPSSDYWVEVNRLADINIVNESTTNSVSYSTVNVTNNEVIFVEDPNLPPGQQGIPGDQALSWVGIF